MTTWEEPFPGSWAVQAGRLTRHQLHMDFDRVHRDVYVRKGVVLDARGRAIAAAHWAKGAGVLVGFSAVAMHDVPWFDDRSAELAGFSRTPDGIIPRQYLLAAEEIADRDGFRVTTPARTAYDLGCRLPLDDAVTVIDALCHVTRTEPEEVAALADRHPGGRGITALRTALSYVDPGAESPPETQTRLLLIQDGLPRPETQITVQLPNGMRGPRIDLGWREWMVGIEYDGVQHWTDPAQRTWDIDRLAMLDALGWIIIRVSAGLLHRRPDVLLERVRHALRLRGANLDP